MRNNAETRGNNAAAQSPWAGVACPATNWKGAAAPIDREGFAVPAEETSEEKRRREDREAEEAARARQARMDAEAEELRRAGHDRAMKDAAHKLKMQDEKRRIEERGLALTREGEDRADAVRREQYESEDLSARHRRAAALREEEIRLRQHDVDGISVDKDRAAAEAGKVEAMTRLQLEQEHARHMERGKLTRAFAAAAERIYRAARPVALTLMLAAMTVLCVRLAVAEFPHIHIPVNGGAGIGAGSGNGGTSTGSGAEPGDNANGHAHGGSMHGDGKPFKTNPNEWGWEKFFKDGKKISPTGGI